MILHVPTLQWVADRVGGGALTTDWLLGVIAAAETLAAEPVPAPAAMPPAPKRREKPEPEPSEEKATEPEPPRKNARSTPQLVEEAIAHLMRQPDRIYASGELRARVSCPEPRWPVIAREISKDARVTVGTGRGNGSTYQAAAAPVSTMPAESKLPSERVRQVVALLELNPRDQHDGATLRDAIECTKSQWTDCLAGLREHPNVLRTGVGPGVRYQWRAS